MKRNAPIEPRRTATWRHRAIAVVTAALGCIGCGGGPESTLQGTVSLDGRPLDRGTVTFIPADGNAGAGATATISPEGTFEASMGSASGLQAGDYIATVRARGDAIPDPKGGVPQPGKLLTPEKYNTAKTSDLRVTVRPGSNDVKLELLTNAK